MGRRIVSALAVALLIPACKFSGFTTMPATIVVAQMRGSQVVPAVATPVTTSDATLSLRGDNRAIDYTVTYTGSGTITSVEIRLGVAGANGPLLFTLTTAPFTNPLTGTLTDGDLNSVPSQDILHLSTAIARVAAGDAYVLVRTAADPNGELRGQLGAATLGAAVLSGAQVTPAPVAGSGTGTFTATFDPAQATITATLTFSGLANPTTAAHLHFGAAGAAPGPAIFDLSTIAFTSPLVVTLTSADFLPDPSCPTFADAVDAFLTGLVYVDLHAAPEELRGQIGPVRLAAAMTDGNVAPPVVNGFTGTANVILHATQTEALVLLTHDVTSADSVRLCAEDPGNNGPQIFDVDAVAGSPASPLTATLQPGHLIPFAPQNLNTFTDAVEAMLRGKTYLEVRSPSFPDGAVRGQLQ
jgi:hypothetical protein